MQTYEGYSHEVCGLKWSGSGAQSWMTPIFSLTVKFPNLKSPIFFLSLQPVHCISIKSSFDYIVNVHRRMPYCSCQKHIKEKKIEVNVLVLMWYFFPFFAAGYSLA